MTAAEEQALRFLSDHARSTITEEKAMELARVFEVPWNMVAPKVGAFEHKGGADLSRRFEGNEGIHVPVYMLAQALADYSGADDNDYPTDYMGTGKRAEALTHKHVLRLRGVLDS